MHLIPHELHVGEVFFPPILLDAAGSPIRNRSQKWTLPTRSRVIDKTESNVPKETRPDQIAEPADNPAKVMQRSRR